MYDDLLCLMLCQYAVRLPNLMGRILQNFQFAFIVIFPAFLTVQDLPENHFRASGASWVNIKVIIKRYNEK